MERAQTGRDAGEAAATASRERWMRRGLEKRRIRRVLEGGEWVYAGLGHREVREPSGRSEQAERTTGY